jgi:hypothetical protein
VLRCVCLCRCAVFRMEETHLDTRLIIYLCRFGPVLVASAALNSDGFRFRCPLTVHLGAGSLVQGWLSSSLQRHGFACSHHSGLCVRIAPTGPIGMQPCGVVRAPGVETITSTVARKLLKRPWGKHPGQNPGRFPSGLTLAFSQCLVRFLPSRPNTRDMPCFLPPRPYLKESGFLLSVSVERNLNAAALRSHFGSSRARRAAA